MWEDVYIYIYICIFVWVRLKNGAQNEFLAARNLCCDASELTGARVPSPKARNSDVSEVAAASEFPNLDAPGPPSTLAEISVSASMLRAEKVSLKITAVRPSRSENVRARGQACKGQFLLQWFPLLLCYSFCSASKPSLFATDPYRFAAKSVVCSTKSRSLLRARYKHMSSPC